MLGGEEYYEELMDKEPENRARSWSVIPQLVKAGVLKPVDVRNIIKLSCKEKNGDIIKLIYIVAYRLIEERIIGLGDLPKCIRTQFYYKAAGFMFDNDDFEGAIRAYTKVIDNQQDASNPLLGRIFADLMPASIKNRNRRNALFNRALSYIILYRTSPKLDYLDLAEEDLEELRKMEELRDDVAFLMGFISEERGNIEEAINWYSTAVKLNKHNRLASEALDRLRKSHY